MKKIITLVFAIAMMCVTMTAQAQEKENAIGFNYAYMTGSNGISHFGIGVKYDHFLTEALRVEGSGTYYFKHKETTWYDLNANFHYLFEVGEKMNVFPVFGFTTLFGHAKIAGDSHNEVRFGCNTGMGAQYNITQDFGVTLEAKYRIVKDFGDFNLSLGCVVLF